jgi:hypothetical protein
MSGDLLSHRAAVLGEMTIKISHSYPGIFRAGVSHQDDCLCHFSNSQSSFGGFRLFDSVRSSSHPLTTVVVLLY